MGGEPKYDIRDWNEKHDKMGKGVTLTETELRKLKELLDAEIAFLDNGTSS
ncbi:PC4/YdbC family ssDNA-binding protein [Phascolarctobacterium sp.]|uniref:PC4/YdbC family ssDNA-binding protein n=1 Tax=Phascolarctobacterium sp. TaxID=2049039 RepID=UPI00307858DE